MGLLSRRVGGCCRYGVVFDIIDFVWELEGEVRNRVGIVFGGRALF